jgi:hypothetical protein
MIILWVVYITVIRFNSDNNANTEKKWKVINIDLKKNINYIMASEYFVLIDFHILP